MQPVPLPDGYHAVNPYLVVPDVDKLIDYLKAVFEARLVERMAGPDGSVAHAEVMIGDSIVMIGGARGEWKAMPSSLYLYVDDTDAAYQRAMDAGSTSIMKPADQFYGDRNAGVKDAWGNMWWIATHQEDVSDEELSRRHEAAMKERAAKGS